MSESRLRQEIRKLVTEQRQLNRRLQQQRRPPGELFSLDKPEASAPSLPQKRELDASSELPQLPVQTPLGNSAEVAADRVTYSFEGEEFQVEKRPKLEAPDEKTATRNRRMFGALAGHLQRAKRQLLMEQSTDLAHKQKQQEERVAQKLAMSQKNIAKIARLEWEERRQQEQLRLEEVSTELSNKENELMRLHLAKHYKNMEVFIGTEAQPTLFWAPAKWDDATRRLQEQTKLWIRTKIEHIEETDYTYRPQGSAAGREDRESSEVKAEGETVAAGEDERAMCTELDTSEPRATKKGLSADSDDASDKVSETKS
ncbi:nuclear factor NF2 [Toxoplasma gondii ME49]|uniref:Nuclear factor NF2 n=4 Tax=Toxoplasma gondii TaxID=5811 RepID=S8F8B5_TOXGM|nr:nuclear factor NF2 [Toxoplasma gondii ME49]EPT30987.1 nuclear factor NF2 [Toxoplasma gondii ME49]|eukprot:XP_002369305.1 nuclear factor NF2 [Toxoplasma gondii ME49]